MLRLLVLGIGLGVITGTGLKLLAPQLSRSGSGSTGPSTAGGALASDGLSALAGRTSLPKGRSLGRFEMRRELTALSQRWAQLAAAQKDLQASAFLVVLDDGRFAQLQPDRPLPAASSIKTPILTATVLRNWLPDLNGTNTTSSRDLARTIALVDTGEKLSPRARDLFRGVLSHSHTNTLIPLGLLQALGKDAADPDSELLADGVTVLNKTGDIGISYADGALIELPDGQRAVAAFMVKGPFNDPRSTDLIRAMAGAMVKELIPTADQPNRRR